MAYNLPSQAVIWINVTKKKIFEKWDLNYKAREEFSKYIQKITREYKIDKDSVWIPKWEKVEWIALFKIILKEKEIPDKILWIINKLISYPILYECESWKNHRYIIKYENEYLKSEWNQDINFDFNGINLDKVYEKIVLKFIEKDDGRVEDFEDAMNWHDKVSNLKKEIEKLEIKIKKEPQYNRQVNLNIQLQAKKKELKELLSRNGDK